MPEEHFLAILPDVAKDDRNTNCSLHRSSHFLALIALVCIALPIPRWFDPSKRTPVRRGLKCQLLRRRSVHLAASNRSPTRRGLKSGIQRTVTDLAVPSDRSSMRRGLK